MENKKIKDNADFDLGTEYTYQEVVDVLIRFSKSLAWNNIILGVIYHLHNCMQTRV